MHKDWIPDRGLQFGDGVFTTAKAVNGDLQLLDLHMKRLLLGCERLGIEKPDALTLRQGLQSRARHVRNGVVKLIITRGEGGRGYATQGCVGPNVYLQDFPLPSFSDTPLALGVANYRLGWQPRLAGIKHLNRLDQVLLKQELAPSGWDDLVVLDYQGNVIETTVANLFWQIEGVWYTPKLNNAGVDGVMRQAILCAFDAQQIPCIEVNARLASLLKAEKVFCCNSLMGIRAVGQIDEVSFADFDHAQLGLEIEV